MGLGRKLFTRERLTAADVQGYLMDQTIMCFASAAARDTAIPTAQREEGMVCYLEDVGRFEFVDADGGGWRYLGGQMPATTNVPIQAGWGASPGRTPRYSLDGHGFINIDGAFTNTGAFTPGTNIKCGQLPVGARPERFTNWIQGANFAQGFYNLEIRTDGGMYVVAPASPAGAGLIWACDGIRFRPA